MKNFIFLLISSLLCLVSCTEKLEKILDEHGNRLDQLEDVAPKVDLSLIFVPEFDDGSAEVSFESTSEGMKPGKAILRFKVAPDAAAATLAEEWNGKISVRAVYTRNVPMTRSEDFMELPIQSITAVKGILSVEVSAANLDQDFFKGKRKAFACLEVHTEETSYVTDFFPLTPNDKNVLIPDPAFKEYLIENFDTDRNGELSKVEAEKIIDIDLSKDFGKHLETLEGIEYMPNLKRLNCIACFLKTLDITHNPKLTYLHAYENKLEHLDLSKNPLLDTLYCDANYLEKLDVSHNPKLVALYCGGNYLKNLDLKHNPELEVLVCGSAIVHVGGFHHKGNSFKYIDVSANKKLRTFYCDNVDLSSISVSRNEMLDTLACGSNNLTDIDISKNKNLTVLSCMDNKLTTLDMTATPNLKGLYCQNNILQSINVSACTNLKQLYCDYNCLTMLDLRSCVDFSRLSCLMNPELKTVYIAPGIASDIFLQWQKDPQTEIVIADIQ